MFQRPPMGLKNAFIKLLQKLSDEIIIKDTKKKCKKQRQIVLLNYRNVWMQVEKRKWRERLRRMVNAGCCKSSSYTGVVPLNCVAWCWQKLVIGWDWQYFNTAEAIMKRRLRCKVGFFLSLICGVLVLLCIEYFVNDLLSWTPNIIHKQNQDMGLMKNTGW